MNRKSIEQARNPDVRASMVAMQRAALRAREVAASTHTSLIVMLDGGWARVAPDKRAVRKS